jgi:hypothetical protein
MARPGAAGQGISRNEEIMEFRIKIEGTEGLLMHNARLSNPLDPAARELKKLTGKRSKTEEDYEAVACAEFAGGLYLDDVVGPYLPADNLFRCLWDAAKKTKSGVKIKEGLIITSLVNPLVYDGPRDPAGLWGNENFRHFASVKVGMQRVIRCRPFFQSWKTEAEGFIDTSIIELYELKQIAETAGMRIGLGDWRPKYGRFTADVEEL